MGYQYQRNIQYLSLWQVLIFCFVAALLLLVVYNIARFLFRSGFAAFAFVGVMFAAFFSYQLMMELFRGIPIGTFTDIIQYVMLFIIAVAVAYRVKGMGRLAGHWLSNNGLKKMPYMVMILAVPLFFVVWLCFAGFLHFLHTNPPGRFFLCCAFFVASAIGCVCGRFRKPLEVKWLKVAMVTLPIVILIQSIIPIIIFASQQRIGEGFHRQEFFITVPPDERPNIYWIHADGMVGFDTMYHFFGDGQEDFRNSLRDRGFWFNETAYFDAWGTTHIAIPTLMSPFYYDRVLAWQLDPAYAESIPKNEDLLENPDLRLDLNFAAYRYAMQRNETIMAFNAAGYSTATISAIDIYFYPTVDRFYEHEFRLTSNRELGEIVYHVEVVSSFRYLINLLSLIAPLPEPMDPDVRAFLNMLTRMGFEDTEIERQVDMFSELDVDSESRQQLEKWNIRADSLYDTFEMDAPGFTLLDFCMAHSPFRYDENGNFLAGGEAGNPERYPAHHIFTAQTLLKYLDIIIDNDPDAIIVIQSDHGIKPSTLEEFPHVFDLTEDLTRALINQIMSAVRLPEEKLTADAIEILSDPRNISRFLMNNFIGVNYEYIPSQFRQTPPEW